MFEWVSKSVSRIYRHRREIFLVGGSVALILYGASKLRNILVYERVEVSRNEGERKKLERHFKSTQSVSDSWVQKSILQVRDQVSRVADVDTILQMLREKQGNKDDNWQELKLRAFTKCITGLYATCLLVIFMKVETSVVGKYMYLEKRSGFGDEDTIRLEYSDQEAIMSLASHVIFRSTEKLASIIRRVVDDETRKFTLNQQVSHGELVSLLSSIRNGVEQGLVAQAQSIGATDSEDVHNSGIMDDLASFLLPQEVLDQDAAFLTRQRDSFGRPIATKFVEAEMADIFESELCAKTFGDLLDQAFSVASNSFYELVPSFKNAQPLPFAKLIPIASKILDEITQKSKSTSLSQSSGEINGCNLVASLLECECIQDLSAVAYADSTM